MKKISMMLLSTLVLTNVTVSAAEALGGEYGSNGFIEYVQNEDPTGPVDPENPDPTDPVEPIDPTDPEGPNPGTPGPLSIDFASSLHFGANKITNADETYYANAQEFNGSLAGETRGNYVQVTDNRGSIAGWTLTVAQTGKQFTSETAKQYKELKGAVITFSDAKAVSNAQGVEIPTVLTKFGLDPEGASSLVMSAKAGAGAGTWADYFGKSEKMTIDGQEVAKNKAVTLEVPGSTPKEATIYKTALTWTLTDAPGQ